MKFTRFAIGIAIGSAALVACSSASSTTCGENDVAGGANGCDGVPDDLGCAVVDGEGNWLQVDMTGDGVADGYGVDLGCDGSADGVLLDTNGNGLGDAVDTNGDHTPDIVTGGSSVGSGGSGNSTGSGGTTSGDGGGSNGTTGGGPNLGTGGDGNNQGGGCLLSSTSAAPSATTTAQYAEANMSRGGVNYKFIANGWNDAIWDGHNISYATQGTAYTINTFTTSGTSSDGAPAGYPTVFCGVYSDKTSGTCGLPKAVSAIGSMQTGLKWSHSAGNGVYNVAYDVWFSNSSGGALTGYFMVWFRDPPSGAQPAGGKQHDRVTVDGVPGVWDIWAGSVNGHPIINYVRPTDQTSTELAFDMVDFFDDATGKRGYTLPGSYVNSVAIGTEVWQGPVTDLEVIDFCVDVQ